ncbi:MAG: cytochrome b [Methylocystis sp.]|nr:cytochrome b [Methylocystis sp.]MCA3582207.1 cytochrome b [Methylocystis sp.]MCA3587901.1 cytochrome b [Methylocystis sp.]MCA3590268.1 cytochrome b [Methylocystis sp.]
MSGPDRLDQGWPGSVRLLHWVSAILILTMLAVGAIMVRIDDTGVRFDLYQSHKALGFAVFCVTLLRALVRLAVARHGPEVSGPRWQARAASWAHGLLYALIFGVTISGWVMASATPLPIPTSVFGLFDLPAIVGRDLATYKLALAVHGWLTKALMALIALHVLAALKRHVIDGDGVLSRMVRGSP